MFSELQALKWYKEQMTAKAHRKLTGKLVALVIIASVLGDAVVPYYTAKVLELLGRGADLRDFIVPLFCVLGGSVFVAFAIPYRQRVRRELQTKGQSALTEKINGIVLASPAATVRLKKMEVQGALKEFFDTWERMLYGFAEALLPLAAGFVGLVVVLCVLAPVALIPAFIMIALVVWVIWGSAPEIDKVWSIYKDREHAELAMTTGVMVSAQMLWLTKLLTVVRRTATTERSDAMDNYARLLLRRNNFMYGVSNATKVAVLVAAVVMVLLLGMPLTVALLLVFYAGDMTNRLSALFGLYEVFANGIVDASLLVRQLDESEPVGPELMGAKSEVRFQGVKVGLGPRPDGTFDKVITFRDITLPPGVTWIKGPSGKGKTTLVRVMSGCQPYLEGSVTIGGKEVREHDVRPVSFYGQQAYDRLPLTPESLFGESPNKGALALALWCAGYPEAPLRRKIDAYSGGELRRIFLALLIYQVIERDRERAGVLSLDEPTNDLDEECVTAVLRGIRWLADSDPDLRIAVVSHNPRIKEIADLEQEM